jgi:hypothetical protein
MAREQVQCWMAVVVAHASRHGPRLVRLQLAPGTDHEAATLDAPPTDDLATVVQVIRQPYDGGVVEPIELAGARVVDDAACDAGRRCRRVPRHRTGRPRRRQQGTPQHGGSENDPPKPHASGIGRPVRTLERLDPASLPLTCLNGIAPRSPLERAEEREAEHRSEFDATLSFPRRETALPPEPRQRGPSRSQDRLVLPLGRLTYELCCEDVRVPRALA